MKRENSVHNSVKSGRHGSASGPDGQKDYRTLRTSESGRSTDRTDALWAEMQSTLEEVELSASGGTHVFGPEHDKRLAELRAAQIALAQAWARNEVDTSSDATSKIRPDDKGTEDVRAATKTQTNDTSLKHVDTEDGSKAAVNPAATRATVENENVEKLELRLEDQTEADILVARKRREANDLYFEKVNNGVLDVVDKLEQVAIAMRAVEQESKDVVWGENVAKTTN